LQPVFVVCPIEMHRRGRFFGTEEVADGFKAVVKSLARRRVWKRQLRMAVMEPEGQ